MEKELKPTKSELLVSPEQKEKWTKEKNKISKQKINPLLEEIYNSKNLSNSLKKKILISRIEIIKEEHSYHSKKYPLPTVLSNDLYIGRNKIDALIKEELKDFTYRKEIHDWKETGRKEKIMKEL